MSTRSAIGYQFNDDRFNMIYCHYDGYPEHVGMLLKQYWNSFEKCDDLVMGPQIRNFDADGTCVRFGDGDAVAFEAYESINEILSSGFDYCYVYDRETGWRCFTKRDGTVVEKTIPSEEPAAEKPFKSLDHTISDFVKASDAKYGSYSHAAGFLTGMLLQTEAYLPANIRQDLIKYLDQATEECKS